MATIPAAPAADVSAPPVDPTAGTEAAPEDQSGGFCVELNVAADGSLSVSVEPAKAEAEEPGEEESAQAVPNLQAAFKLIKEIVNQGGQMADTNASQDQMAGGYNSTGM